MLGTEATEKEVSDACRTALAYDMSSAWKGMFSIQESIQEFLNRDAGIKGSKLSGGEKQRVACARAVLKKPQVFLMDEGTSALDRDTEHRVQNNIDKSLKGITLVSIAHRI
jgi:ATP-binding cassette, subfamily B (MDR/TAP), member 1